MRRRITFFISKQIYLLQQEGVAGLVERIKRKASRIQLYVSNRFIGNQKSYSKQALDTILVISGCENTPAEIHRVFHFVEKCNFIDEKVKVVGHGTLKIENLQELKNFKLLYLHRVAMEPLISDLISFYQKNQKLVIYDIDDLVFDETVMPEINAIKHFSSFELNLYRETVIRYFECMKAADIIVTPTSYLSKYAAKLFKKPSYVLKNGVGSNFIRHSENPQFERKANQFKIGYFPGTNTHNDDFEMIAPALARLLRSEPSLKIQIVGPLELSDTLKEFADRFEEVPLVDYRDLGKYYEKIDLNIAPLCLDNSYNNAKSEIKFLFASFYKIPTVASPTMTYQELHKEGMPIILASTQKEWITTIRKLMQDKEYRLKMGSLAHGFVNNQYSMKALGLELKHFLKDIQNT